jgi:curved DNA-binding protein CbpA
MKNLYDILDARADDDAETLKLAFRKAVKTCHPDLKIANPDAPARFRELVQAKAILCNPQLRAAYDRMLEFECEQLRPVSGWSATRSILSNTIGMVSLAALLAGAYTVFTYISENPVVKTKPDDVVTVHQVVDVTAARVPRPVAAANRDSEHDESESAESPIARGSRTTGSVVDTLPSNKLGLNRLSAHLHEQGIASYHKGDISSAITNFDLAIRLDPDFESAYIDRSIALYRIREFSRAFADIGQAIRIENSRRTVTPSAR